MARAARVFWRLRSDGCGDPIQRAQAPDAQPFRHIYSTAGRLSGVSFGYNVDMFWLTIAFTLVAVVVVMTVIFAKRQAADHDGKRAVADLGSVSNSWITEHRTER